jgi:hypothetical protein
MTELNDESLERFAKDFIFYAATESGFFTDGENYFLTPEQLIEIKSGNDYDFTELLANFSFHIVYKIIELQELQDLQGYEGVRQ